MPRRRRSISQSLVSYDSVATRTVLRNNTIRLRESEKIAQFDVSVRKGVSSQSMKTRDRKKTAKRFSRMSFSCFLLLLLVVLFLFRQSIWFFSFDESSFRSIFPFSLSLQSTSSHKYKYLCSHSLTSFHYLSHSIPTQWLNVSNPSSNEVQLLSRWPIWEPSVNPSMPIGQLSVITSCPDRTPTWARTSSTKKTSDLFWNVSMVVSDSYSSDFDLLFFPIVSFRLRRLNRCARLHERTSDSTGRRC